MQYGSFIHVHHVVYLSSPNCIYDFDNYHIHIYLIVHVIISWFPFAEMAQKQTSWHMMCINQLYLMWCVSFSKLQYDNVYCQVH
jgi:hypothetical protein